MKFTPLKIPDVILIEPNVHGDGRGFFFESYHEKVFAEHGINDRFVQDNHSSSVKGVLRGLHYQIAPKAQAKLIRVIRGSIFDVAVDIRKDSKTFGQHVTMTLTAEKREMLYIPAGFAHGFCVLENGTEVFYKVSDFYSPADERGILWNDPKLAIPWPPLKIDYLLSERDRKHPPFLEAVHV
ncbi:MAG: dTDP-4-dehydrorhamnose 3,5-epimerase [Candidatus Omnitrophica bacterium CG11_big_fil_rev_8_21_14_0_20_45_26]|uniref:dTDP-4-dehydrorhamnose 3,5-epimerase n=1 Tax=Candidatus Abzuiibacterium crystallinum TaxID=1974748 RepID=A0A2H0LSF8_9BACT|nr:MAG: dTDP-4-dehydrorhamnose 3,5-epimerase [Candidatus Omnitrophica bacterium CG11_big_fil_rev_8_21_14_0_20_45_26]PIW63485.1 MAG: dTDP-4-dehydrorhamnose 3,5-epimerase [Candidatus Omnitrophica bacterium CG12_big_fil_rev_8_21_14_0_65_45_16]